MNADKEKSVAATKTFVMTLLVLLKLTFYSASKKKKFKFIVTIARGTSDCAALFGSYIFAKYLGLPTYSMPPSIMTLEKSKFDFSPAFKKVLDPDNPRYLTKITQTY